MLRKLGIGFIALAVMMPGLAAALGVGGYHLNSYLNQPLDMTVKLHDLKGLSADQVIVKLAPQSAFDAAGVDRTFFLSDLKFKVTVNGDNGVVHITSDKPVREPYLDFLVQFLWPTGRLMREYTVLLDPPSYDNSTSTVSPASAAAQAKPVTPSPSAPPPTAPAPAQSASPQTPAARPSSGAPSPGGGTYTVKGSDTMWRIASDHRPTNTVSVQQTMLAIQKMNPDAFIDHNVNLVRRGAVLRLPSEHQIRQVSSRQAMARMASQNRRWQRLVRQQKGATNPTHAPVDASGGHQASNSPGGSGNGGQVTLVTPNSAGGVKNGDTTGAGGGKGSANTAALQNELAIRDETLDKLHSENKELSSRISALKDQVDTSQKLLKLRSEQIAALQQELRKLQKEKDVKVNPALMKSPAQAPATANSNAAGAATAQGANGPVGGAAKPPTANGATGSGTAGENGAKPAAQSQAGESQSKPKNPATAAVKAPAKPTVAKAPRGEAGGIIGFLMGNLLYVGVALVLILLLVLLLLRRRSSGGDDGAVGDSGHDGGEGLDGGPGFGALADQPTETHEPPADDFQDDSMDPMERADVYVAYGQYSQAVDYLRNEINQAPDRGDLKIRLLELLKEMNDEPGFRQQAAMYAGTGEAVDAAIKRLGGDPGGAAPGGDPDLSLDDLEMDLASDLPDRDTAARPAAPRVDQAEEPDDLDFRFGDDEEDQAPTALKDETPLELNDLVLSEPDAEQQEDESLAFNLDGDGEDLGFSEEELSALENVEAEPAAGDGGEEDFADLNLDDLDLDEAALDGDLSLEDTERAEAGDDGLEDGLGDLDFGDLELDSDAEAPRQGDHPEEEPEREPVSEPVADTSEPVGDSNDELDLDDDQALDLDDLDLSLDDLDLDDTATTAEPHQEDPEHSLELDREGDDEALDLSDLDLDFEDAPVSEEAAPAVGEAEPEWSNPLDQDEPERAEEPPAANTGPSEPSEVEDDMLGEDDDFDFLGETDENATKLDLARAYIDMGDTDGARDILNEVLSEGSEEQQSEAKELLARVS